MKTLYLLRHAKSSWGDPKLPDHERPLNERGRKAAVTMGRHLRQQQVLLDLVLASTAQRVSETLELLLPELDHSPKIRRERTLYLAPPTRLLASLHSASKTPNNVLIVGHNPGIHEFAVHLVGEVADDDAYEARERMKAGYPTAALAVIRFARAESWSEVKFGDGELAEFTKPRDLKSR